MQNRGVEQSGRRPRPEWSRPGSVALVFLGGCFGAGVREALTVIVPAAGPIPTPILIANLLGAFLLGLLLEALIRSTSRGAARARLLLGTGVLGGFTTYSALALAVAELVIEGQQWIALAYGAGTVIVGALATWAGIAAGAALRSGTSRRGGRGAEGGDV